MQLDFLTPEQKAFLIEFEPPKNCLLATVWLEGAIDPFFLQTVFDEKKSAVLEAQNGPLAERERAVYLAERAHFSQIAAALEGQKDGPDWLWETWPQRTVAERLREMDGAFFRLHAFSILPNGAHFLIDFEAQFAQNQRIIDRKHAGLVPALRILKSTTGHALQQRSNRLGQLFWAVPHAERRIERADHFFAAVDFVVQSPVRAGLCDSWQEHDGTWADPVFLNFG